MSFFTAATLAVRRCRHRPSVPLTASIMLALGIGLATSFFTVLNAVVWRPMPLPQPDRLVWINTSDGAEPEAVSPGLLLAWMDRARSLQRVAGIRTADATFSLDGRFERLRGAFVTASYFPTLGLSALHGRVFGADLDLVQAEPVLVVSERLWRTQFAASPAIVGRVVTLNGRRHTVIGVLPRDLDTLQLGHDWWAPLSLTPAQRSNIGSRYLDAIGRMTPDADPPRVQSELAGITAALGARSDNGTALGITVSSFESRLLRQHRPTLVALFVAVLLLLLIACVNVANLLVADGVTRRRESAVRASLGATDRQLLLETGMEMVLISAAASVLGVIVASWGTDVLVAILPADTPRLSEAGVDRAALGFAFAAGAASAAIGGIVPGLRRLRTDPIDALRDGGRATAPGDVRLRGAFVVAQLAVAMTLALAAALMLRSAQALEAAPRGYDARGVLTAAFALPDGTRESADLLIERILAIVQGTPGVARAAIAARVPLAGGTAGSNIERFGGTFDGRAERQARIRLVTPGYFAALRVAVLAGREFSRADTAAGRPVVIVNEALARRLGLAAPFVGASVQFELPVFNQRDRVTPWEIVGVVADTHDAGPREPITPEIFVTFSQAPSEVLAWLNRQALLVVRSERHPDSLGSALRASLAAAGVPTPLYDVKSLDARFGDHIARERLVSRLLVLVGLAGAMLSAFGTFALVSHVVRGQRRNLAIRLALGATRATVTGGIVGRGMVSWLAGAALGVVGWLAVARVLESLLFGVTAMDPATVAAVAGVLGIATLAAVWLPARSAARIDPAVTLRQE